jgi:hypothetical protein
MVVATLLLGTFTLNLNTFIMNHLLFENLLVIDMLDKLLQQTIWLVWLFIPNLLQPSHCAILVVALHPILSHGE